MPTWHSPIYRSLGTVFRRHSRPAGSENQIVEDQHQAETPLLSGHVDGKDSRGFLNCIRDLLINLSQPKVSGSSTVVAILLVLCSCITSTTLGYDASMMNGLNMLPSYTEYFHLNTVTMSMTTSALWIRGALAGLSYGQVTDAIGRRNSLFWAAVMTLVAWRAWGVGLLNDCYYLGGFIAAGITYKTATIDSTWMSGVVSELENRTDLYQAWRIPSVVQGIFSVPCILILPFIPESPRWLANVGRKEEALTVLAQTYADRNETDAVVLAQYQQIIETIHYEREIGENLSLEQLVKSSNVIVSYCLGTMLSNAGIVNVTDQLPINIALNAFCLCCALPGTYYSD
ncbi:hypothetical protein ONS96_006836 [Cadophora gregata f. sp. sojae]|nr:hypothetical protein ONS96_006836 [Cadophora gregata f. sp. sojae]